MQLSKIVTGAMRFKNKKSASLIIRKAIDAGFNYIDTSPRYCYKSETENSEAWVGHALSAPEYRDRVLVSTKSSTGNGGLQLGTNDPVQGFGVRTSGQLDAVFNQSLTRLKMPAIDYYHLWTVHTLEQFAEAFKPNGWYDGVMKQKQAGRFTHLGITTHADPETIIDFLKSKKFSLVTIPLNVINRTRLKVVDYCASNNIEVIAMNPLAGGFLAAHAQLKQLAFRYLMTLPNVHILVGFSTPNEVDYAKWIIDTAAEYKKSRGEILDKVDSIIGSNEPRCTGCGYCQPCPNNINVGACLSYFNIYKYMHLPHAKKAFHEKQWEEGLRLDRCTHCGSCSLRCPNHLPLNKILRDAKRTLYDKN
jgi:hypothetical protein